jgi:hypothetical protein
MLILKFLTPSLAQVPFNDTTETREENPRSFLKAHRKTGQIKSIEKAAQILRQSIRGSASDPAPPGISFVGVKRSWDEATSRIYLGDGQHFDHLVSVLGIPAAALQPFKRKRPSVAVSVLQQRCTIRIDEIVSPVYKPGKLMERLTAANIFQTLEASSPEVSVERLRSLSSSVPWVFLGLLGDSVATNEAVITCFAKELPETIVDAGRCTMHQGHLVFTHGLGPLNLVSPLHCLGCAFKSSGNQRKLQQALWSVAKTVRIRFEQPPAEAARFSNFVLEHTICDFAGYHSLEDEAPPFQRLPLPATPALPIHIVSGQPTARFPVFAPSSICMCFLSQVN